MRTEPSHKRVRVFFGGQPIVDTDDALYVWEWPAYPQYYLPLADVAEGVLHPTQQRDGATYYAVRVGSREAVDAAWSYDDSDTEELRGRVRFDWNAMDAWFEEDEEAFVHPRDPHARVQILPSSRHVTVAVDGVTVADTQRPMFLYETGLPRRTYFPKLDVRMELLLPSPKTSMCPYKGTARYWSVIGRPDLAWSYPAPFRESAPIAGLVAFFDEKVDVTVDGVAQPRPQTPFS